ncbi:hypothetical protein [Bacteroides salyersiae]|uniref:hypothetical protein n=1 Tax=Bacteroides salyersiae TaxID=291644 RepID=UPI002166A9AE|nr:hypothetical protein [Bacteroides salyersiae]MCS3057454.1 hypothetical protein [Bacteroides salyersiae]
MKVLLQIGECFYLATAGYTYDDKYIVDAAIRRDGSSRFGADNQFGTFGLSV